MSPVVLLSLLFWAVVEAGSFAHITDLHLDLYYRTGTDTLGYCRGPNPGYSGRFGTRSNRCDSPFKLIRDTLVWISTRNPPVDFVLVTGNMAKRTKVELAVNVSETSEEDDTVAEMLHSIVGNPLPIILAIGGSDLSPESDCVQNDPQFYRLLNGSWGPFFQQNHWLVPSNTQSFLNWGCYNVTINGFGVIVLNTEFWTKENGLGSSSDCDPNNVGDRIFKWAADLLRAYNSTGMKVIITGNRKYYTDDASNGYRVTCGDLYVKLATDFEDVIVAHIYGGSHEDSFSVIRNNVDFRKHLYTGVVWVSPSVLPVYNPAIRIYEYSNGGALPAGSITDYVQYYANLDQANAAFSEPKFIEEYRASTSYGLSNFTVAAWSDLDSRLRTDLALRKVVESHRVVMSEQPLSPTPQILDPEDTVAVAITASVLVLLAGAIALFKCRQFKNKTYAQELKLGLRP